VGDNEDGQSRTVSKQSPEGLGDPARAELDEQRSVGVFQKLQHNTPNFKKFTKAIKNDATMVWFNNHTAFIQKVSIQTKQGVGGS
jgi:hypothetical protein